MSATIQTVLADSLRRLVSVSIAAGLSPAGAKATFPAIRSFAELLRTCPDDDGARRFVRRYSAGASGFLMLAHENVKSVGEGTTQFYDREIDASVGPYFYLADSVVSLIDDFESEIDRRKTST